MKRIKKFVADFKAKYNKLPDFLYGIWVWCGSSVRRSGQKKRVEASRAMIYWKRLKALRSTARAAPLWSIRKQITRFKHSMPAKNVMKDGKVKFELIEKVGEFTMPEKRSGKTIKRLHTYLHSRCHPSTRRHERVACLVREWDPSSASIADFRKEHMLNFPTE